MLASVYPADGLSAWLELADITGRHYRLKPVLNTQNATVENSHNSPYQSVTSAGSSEEFCL
jgi:hypothetical protein